MKFSIFLSCTTMISIFLHTTIIIVYLLRYQLKISSITLNWILDCAIEEMGNNSLLCEGFQSSSRDTQRWQVCCRLCRLQQLTEADNSSNSSSNNDSTATSNNGRCEDMPWKESALGAQQYFEHRAGALSSCLLHGMIVDTCCF